MYNFMAQAPIKPSAPKLVQAGLSFPSHLSWADDLYLAHLPLNRSLMVMMVFAMTSFIFVYDILSQHLDGPFNDQDFMN